MTNFELVLIILACSVPVVALLFVLPKLKKKEKKQVEVQTKTYEEIKKEEPQLEQKSEKKTEPKVEVLQKNDISSEDFKNYLNIKQNRISRPSRVELPKDFEDRTMPYAPRRARRSVEKPSSVAEEICSLSPELKALIFTGALDKKDFK